ncbi:hypothetical protein ZIOFF_016735 [Zingiber officinale]|uniref:Uncharacterized protein n=1 Tax=Zingiber officinale TaxID=94328 RepID=A0A8J5HT57_ZINOF|nr:hypothetical protein ZIOFF_016735 [Zingiber officinale]
MGSGDAFPHDGAAIKPSVESSAKGSDLEALTSTVTSSGRKNGGSKDIGYSVLNSINKSTSQIKKPNHRKNVSPLNWFPRKRADSFLKRKIKHLQEIAGMNLSLDETLGNANPHYTRITREKIAAREAAQKAMEARKAALVEASWCRILGAARINSKEAEARLQKAEKCAEEAFEAARSLGVMMYDRPDSQRRPYEIETSLGIGGKSTHKVTAAFETAFDVDKEVTAAVKRAFVMLANCSSSSSKEEFRNLLCKISQNPDINRSTEVMMPTIRRPPTLQLKVYQMHLLSLKVILLLSTSDGSSSSSMSPTKLTNNMFDRLKCLHEDELSSLAVIVATCGLNAALREMKRTKNDDVESVTTEARKSNAALEDNRKFGTLEKQGAAIENLEPVISEVPSLDKFLVKHVSKLEQEVHEAKKNSASLEDQRMLGTLVNEDVKRKLFNHEPVITEVPKNKKQIPIKHLHKTDKCMHGTEKQALKATEVVRKGNKTKQQSEELPGLDEIMVKRQSKLEKAKQSATQESADYVKHETRREAREKELEAAWGGLSLGNSMRPHLSRIEQEKASLNLRSDLILINNSRNLSILSHDTNCLMNRSDLLIHNSLSTPGLYILRMSFYLVNSSQKKKDQSWEKYLIKYIYKLKLSKQKQKIVLISLGCGKNSHQMQGTRYNISSQTKLNIDTWYSLEYRMQSRLGCKKIHHKKSAQTYKGGVCHYPLCHVP